MKDNSQEYPIYFFETDTSGEKTFEEFYTEKENYILNDFKSLGYINCDDINISFDKIKDDFNNIFDNPSSSKSDIINIIKKYIPTFEHIETGKNLDQKM